jgi:chromosomal replication initiation ATPase DnaA
VIGGSILGSRTFIDRVKDTFLPVKSSEIPAVRHLKKYKKKEGIVEAICKSVGKSFHEIISDRSNVRQIAMDLLYRFVVLKGTEIGEMMGIDYSTVSQGRKRLREK